MIDIAWHAFSFRNTKTNSQKTMTTLTKNNRTRPAVFNSYFDRFLRDPFDLWEGQKQGTSTVPSLNIKEEEKKYKVELAVPGKKKEDFNIEVDDNLVTISSESSEENKDEDDGYSFREYNYTSFSRSFSMPENADTDKVTAKYSDGVLCLNIPKKEMSIKQKKNKIKVE